MELLHARLAGLDLAEVQARQALAHHLEVAHAVLELLELAPRRLDRAAAHPARPGGAAHQATSRRGSSAPPSPSTSASAATTSGSNALPARSRSHATASPAVSAGRYGSLAVRAANASRTPISRAPPGIARPDRPRGK